MSRIPLITSKDGLSVEQRAVFDSVVESRGQMLRPFEVLLHKPAIAAHAGALGATIRFDSELADLDRELLILATAFEHECLFEWDTHVEVARAAGMSEATIMAVREEQSDLGKRETSLLVFARELCRTSTVSDGTFAEAHELLGTSGLVEATATIGYYTMLAYAMNACGAC